MHVYQVTDVWQGVCSCQSRYGITLPSVPGLSVAEGRIRGANLKHVCVSETHREKQRLYELVQELHFQHSCQLKSQTAHFVYVEDKVVLPLIQPPALV